MPGVFRQEELDGVGVNNSFQYAPIDVGAFPNDGKGAGGLKNHTLNLV